MIKKLKDGRTRIFANASNCQCNGELVRFDFEQVVFDALVQAGSNKEADEWRSAYLWDPKWNNNGLELALQFVDVVDMIPGRVHLKEGFPKVSSREIISLVEYNAL